MHCGELANYENLYHFKLRLFPNLLTGAAFTWYTTLPRNSIQSWQEMERKFHTQFFKVQLEVCIEELSRVTQRNGEPVDLFISQFKKMRNRCKIHLLKTKYVKMAQKGLDIELRKKFQGMEFRDFYELVAKVTKYEKLLKEESYQRKKSMGTYCQEVNQEVAMSSLSTTGTFTYHLLVEKALEVWKKTQIVGTQVQYTFKVGKTKEILDFLMKEKFITFLKDHWIPSKDEQKGKTYCKYRNSWNHTTNACWGFRNVIQDMINKGIFKFPDKKEAMAINEDPFSLVASINTSNFDLRALIESKNVGKLSPRNVWIPKYCLVRVDRWKNESAAFCTDPP